MMRNAHDVPRVHERLLPDKVPHEACRRGLAVGFRGSETPRGAAQGAVQVGAWGEAQHGGDVGVMRTGVSGSIIARLGVLLYGSLQVGQSGSKSGSVVLLFGALEWMWLLSKSSGERVSWHLVQQRDEDIVVRWRVGPRGR